MQEGVSSGLGGGEHAWQTEGPVHDCGWGGLRFEVEGCYYAKGVAGAAHGVVYVWVGSRGCVDEAAVGENDVKTDDSVEGQTPSP